jgi:hypothetical protein
MTLLFAPDEAFLPELLRDETLRATDNSSNVDASSVRYYNRFDGERPKRVFGGGSLAFG